MNLYRARWVSRVIKLGRLVRYRTADVDACLLAETAAYTHLVRCVLLLLAACSGPDVLSARELPANIQPTADAVVAANNQLACDVYAKLPPGNAVFSPFSIATALTMLEIGAAGQTDSELRAALHLTLPPDQLASAYDALLTSLDTGRSYGVYSLATADRVFGQQGFAFQQLYLDTTKIAFHAPLQPLDFQTSPDAARTTINNWVATQTDNKIVELFPSGSIGSDTRLVVANAIVFKGDWNQQFDPAHTAPGAFHVSGAGDVSTPLMHASYPVKLGAFGNVAQLGALPFRGEDLALVVIVPNDPDGLPALEARLTGPALSTAISDALDRGEPNDITLPKFAITQNQTLNALLSALGIQTAFTPSADFSGIDGAHDLVLSEVSHDAMITVDEQGAEAAAATGGGITQTSYPQSLTVNRSFVYVLYDNVTGSILFMGRVVDPTQP